MPKAARVGDDHLCPAYRGDTPHRCGPILPPGEPTVFINNRPAARVGDTATCNAEPDVIARGARSVLIGGAPAARLGDLTAHGGQIAAGEDTVLIEEGSMGRDATPGPSAVRVGKGRHWIAFELTDEADQPVSGEVYEIVLSDGRVIRSALDADGRVRIEGLEDAEECQFTFLHLDTEAWAKR
jgi:uncharacterized Zn-binding protein involved in type VI secretion